MVGVGYQGTIDKQTVAVGEVGGWRGEPREELQDNTRCFARQRGIYACTFLVYHMVRNAPCSPSYFASENYLGDFYRIADR